MSDIKRLQSGPRMSQAVVHGNTVYTAGQVALNAPGASVADQTRDILAAIESVYVAVAVTTGVELFATRLRYSGFSIGYNIAVAAFGGTTPYVVTWLTDRTGDDLAPAWYLIAAAVVSLLTVLTVGETAGRPLAAVAGTENAPQTGDVPR